MYRDAAREFSGLHTKANALAASFTRQRLGSTDQGGTDPAAAHRLGPYHEPVYLRAVLSSLPNVGSRSTIPSNLAASSGSVAVPCDQVGAQAVLLSAVPLRVERRVGV